MSFAVVALILGLVLLLVAAGLFLRASRQDSGRDSGQESRQDARRRTTPTRVTGGPSSPDTGQGGGTGRVTPRKRSADPGAGAGTVGDAASGPDAPSGEEPTEHPVSSGSTVSDDSREAPEPAEPGMTTSATPSPEPSAAPAPAQINASFSGRRGRRHWAAARGFEYTREDAFLTAEWPESLLREMSPTDQGPPARDLVSGFVDGRQLHIADVLGGTVFALRRGAYSPVNVHATVAAAMPAGMRHDAAFDRAPFTVYASDTRALGRMLDSRVENALAAMAGVVTDVVFGGAWVVARCTRRADADRWDRLLPHLVALGDAARVLPPLVTSATLDIAVADPTRPRPASGVTVNPGAVGAVSAAEDAAEKQEPARPGHLRAVPDAPAEGSSAPTVPPEQADAAGSGATGPDPTDPSLTDPLDTEGTRGFPDRSGGHPAVERPAEPVEFPTRSRGRVFGDADLDGSWPEDVAEDGLTSIPALGEEPSPSAGPGPGDPRIMRTGASATIFTDADADAVAEDGEAGAAGAATVPGAAADTADPGGNPGGRPGNSPGADPGEPGGTPSRPRGRHRGPDARHAGSDGGDADPYDVVDPEVVDPED